MMDFLQPADNNADDRAGTSGIGHAVNSGGGGRGVMKKLVK
jgi:hypothetical protein